MGFQTQNPATGEILKNYEHLAASEVEKRIEEAFRQYHRYSFSTTRHEKSQRLKALAQGLRSQKDSLARQMTLEMGKAIQDSFAEIEKCAVTCEYFAEQLPRFLEDHPVNLGVQSAKIVKDPMGPILAIMPWNFPIWQVIRFAAPAVGIGNPILLKHSDLTAGSAEMLAQIFDRVHEGLLFNLQIDHNQAARVIADKRVRGVTLTGSARAGREVAAVAGQNLKKVVLELGGNDAYVVFADSAIEKSAKICAKARMTNNGQSCVAAKRFIVEASVLDEFMKHFTTELREYRYGDPLEGKTKVGSLAAKKFQKQLLEQCRSLEKAGAKKVFDLAEDFKFTFTSPDAYFPPRVYLIDQDIDMAFEEEFFGPVALVFPFKSEDEALALCNRSPYGLGGAVFSEDAAKGQTFARKMECGFVAINEQVKSDARLPFGGVKNSGHGRELSIYGFNEFCNIKALTNLPSSEV
jgi:succinate-semialdehyde dehydrogenase/glutarate-semialdehyde dehydrogenase